jgi:hypothetical protein
MSQFTGVAIKFDTLGQLEHLARLACEEGLKVYTINITKGPYFRDDMIFGYGTYNNTVGGYKIISYSDFISNYKPTYIDDDEENIYD